MATYSIYDKNGTLRYSAKSIKFSSSFMQVATLTVTVKSATTIAFEIGDYVDYAYDGLRYTIRETPTPKKVASSGSYGEAFQYELIFRSPLWELSNCPFKDYVLNDNNAHFTSLPDVSTYEKPSGIINRIKANIERFSATDTASVIGQWSFLNDWIPSGQTDSLDAKDFTLSSSSCLDALNEIFNLWKLSYRLVKVNNVNTIRVNSITARDSSSNLFKYGKGQGLKAIKKNIQNGDKIATRIYAYGNTTNMQSRHYNKVTYNGKQVVGDNMYIPNLMLPMSSWGVTRWYKWVHGNDELYTLSSNPVGTLAFNIPSIGGIGYTVTQSSSNEYIIVGGVTYTSAAYDDFPDVTKAYYQPSDASFVTKYGVRPKSLYYDGSDDRDDIYPSIKGVTIGNLRSAIPSTDTYYPSTTIYTDTNERIDEIKAVTPIADNGDKDTTHYLDDITVTESGTRSETKSVSVSTSLRRYSVFMDNLYSGTLTNGGKLYFGEPIVPIIITSIASGLTILEARYDIYNNGLLVGSYPLTNINRQAPFAYKMEDTPNGINVSAGSISIRASFRVTSATSGIYSIVLSNSSNSIRYYTKSSLGTDVFQVTLKQLGFDINKYVNTEGAQLCMLDGRCGGYKFNIKAGGAVYDSTTQTWKLTCYRIAYDTLNIYYPNSNSMIAQGNHFVLLGMDMPDVYINFAEQNLLAAAQVETPWIEKFIIEPEIDNLQMARSPQTLSAGMWMQVLDTDLGLADGANSVYVLIDAVTVDDNGTDLPKFSVTLRDE